MLKTGLRLSTRNIFISLFMFRHINSHTSLLSLLCFASFRLAILNTKDKLLEVTNVTIIRPPPCHIVALINSYPLCNDDALQPVAPAHCQLATSCLVWLDGLSVASGGLSCK